MGLLFSLSTSALLRGAVAAAITNPGEWAALIREYKSGTNAIGSVALVGIGVVLGLELMAHLDMSRVSVRVRVDAHI